MPPHWSFLAPNLAVRDVVAAQAWYRHVLGFGVNWLWEDNFGSVGLDHAEVFLYESDEPAPGVCSVFVDDVDAVYRRCRERGGDIVSPLEDKLWNVREFSVRDPDGNVFRIGTGAVEPVERPELTFPGRA
jgi:catechol 2,3-dioxygenase-like lactoylglutathione lyase family enzyme